MAKKQQASACESPARVDIGGQAVMEGVMMKAPHAIAVAVRKPDGTIAVEAEPYHSIAEKHSWMKWPVVRGCVNMVTMLKMGMDTLNKSTRMLGVLEEEPSKFEKWLAAKLGKSIDKIIMGTAMVLAVGLSLLLFVFLPSIVGTLVNQVSTSPIVVNLAAGAVRVLILIAYIGLTGLIPDMKRVFQYHGAEHKTVYCNEHGLELTPENAQQFSTLHPRCGTSFLLLVMIISILVGAVADQLIMLIFGIPKMSYIARLARSLLLIPVITGVSYEALKGLAHAENWLVKALRWPGLQMQRLTTRQPDEAMLEVAIASMQAALTLNDKILAQRAGKAVPEDAPDSPPVSPAVITAVAEDIALEAQPGAEQ